MGRRVDVDDLLDAGAVARLMGLADGKAVSTYRTRHEDFPAPVLRGDGGKGTYWVRQDVEAWREANPGRRRE